MIGAVLEPPLWIELPAVIAGALAGALFAQKRGARRDRGLGPCPRERTGGRDPS